MSRCSELLCKLNSIDELDLSAGVPIRKSIGLVGIHESTNWDRSKGIGKIPRQIDDDMYYFGFEYSMLPSEFLSLVPPRPDSHDDLVEIIKSGSAIANPWLDIEWNPETKQWKVLGHEGRGRILAHKELYGDVPVLIGMFPREVKYEMRARDLTDEMLSAVLTPQRTSRDMNFKLTLDPTKAVRS